MIIPKRVGWVLLGYSIIFGIGVTAWSFVLPRLSLPRALRITLIAMLLVCGEFFLFNHVGSVTARWVVGIVTAVTINDRERFYARCAAATGHSDRSAGRTRPAMGIYSVPLSVGAIIGSLIAAALGKRFAVDGLIYGTLAMAVIALLFVRRLDAERSIVASFGCGLRIKLGVGSPILYMLRCESAKYTVGIDSRRQAAL